MPTSGTSEELLHSAGIDADAIVLAVQRALGLSHTAESTAALHV